MNRLTATPQRRIAMMALLLASFLEICGCNPVRSCEQLRATRLSAVPWESLVEQCARCLSAREMLVLRQTQETSVVYSVADTLLQDATVEESLGAVHGPSFEIAFGSNRDDLNRDRGIPEIAVDRGGVQEGSGSTEMKPIAWPIPESVLFLYAKVPIRDTAAQRIATGFILSLPRASAGSVKFLVTARHVVDPAWARCGQPNPQSITVRFNRRMGGITYRTITLEQNDRRYFLTSINEATDLVLIPLTHKEVPDLEEFKLADTTLDALPTGPELSLLHEEQQIATVGVASPKLFGLTDFPISESGMIASTGAGAQVPVRCVLESPAKPVQIWLINANVQRGLSGAPVYAAFARGPQHVATPLLVGIQAIVWPDRGEAGITPVAALLEMIETQRHTTRLALKGSEPPPG